MTLEEAIEIFKEQNSHLALPKEAYLQCDTVTHIFLSFLGTCGVQVHCKEFWFCCTDRNNPAPDLYKTEDHDTEEWQNSNSHCVVETPDFYLDFTARQYRSTHDFPQRIPKAKAAGASVQ